MADMEKLDVDSFEDAFFTASEEVEDTVLYVLMNNTDHDEGIEVLRRVIEVCKQGIQIIEGMK